ncbi:MAG: radical SAM protein [Alphaproteobacteria bacterium]
MAPVSVAPQQRLDRGKFQDADRTANGEARATVALGGLRALWFNTGSQCNITCANCYVESSPGNDRLAYITRQEVELYLDEIADSNLATEEIGLTGGEPFMNPDIVAILETCLGRGLRVLVLTNAMRPMERHVSALSRLRAKYGDRLNVRVSLDHYRRTAHEAERGVGTWDIALDGLRFLSENGFNVCVAGRTCWDEDEAALRAGFARLFAAQRIDIDAADSDRLVLFPEMDEAADVAEITTACWDILGVRPEAQMCAFSRMVVKRKGAARPSVVTCTLLPYDPRFELGTTLAEARGPVSLNHPHCARFCVLGGGSCTAG